MIKPTERKDFDILISFDNAGFPVWKMRYKGCSCMINNEVKQFVIDTLHEIENENEIKNKLNEKD